MLLMLRQRNFTLLWFAGLISMIGDWTLRIGLPLYSYSLTGSTLATGALVIVGTAPGLIFGSVAGVFVDRWDRRRTMVVVSLLQAAILLPLLLVRSADDLWIVYGVLFVGATLARFFAPAEQALLPTLVDSSQLVSANSMNALNGNLARLLGPALGGLIVGAGGIVGIALVDAVTFLVAALLIVAVVIVPSGAREPGSAGRSASVAGAARGVARSWSEGLAYIRHRPALARLLGIIAITNIGEGFIGTLLVPFVIHDLGGTEADYGYLMAVQAVGGILGSALVAQVAARYPAYRLFGVCCVIFGLIDLALFTAPLFGYGVSAGIVIIALAGVPAIGLGAAFMTLMQTLTDDAYRGRVFGTYAALSALLMLVGATVAGVLGETVPTILLLSVQGVGYAAAGVLALVLLKPRSDRPAPSPELGAA